MTAPAAERSWYIIEVKKQKFLSMLLKKTSRKRHCSRTPRISHIKNRETLLLDKSAFLIKKRLKKPDC